MYYAILENTETGARCIAHWAKTKKEVVVILTEFEEKAFKFNPKVRFHICMVDWCKDLICRETHDINGVNYELSGESIGEIDDFLNL